MFDIICAINHFPIEKVKLIIQGEFLVISMSSLLKLGFSLLLSINLILVIL